MPEDIMAFVFMLEFVPQKPMPGKLLVQLTWQLTNDS